MSCQLGDQRRQAGSRLVRRLHRLLDPAAVVYHAQQAEIARRAAQLVCHLAQRLQFSLAKGLLQAGNRQLGLLAEHREQLQQHRAPQAVELLGQVVQIELLLRWIGSLGGCRCRRLRSNGGRGNDHTEAMALGAKVVTVSDSSGTIIDEDGFTPEKLAILMDVKNHHYGRVSDYAARTGTRFEAGVRPWHVPVDVALPCATQNELDESDARTLIANGVICVAEGANMPSTIEAAKAFEAAGVLYAPGKASNAGGVATSGLEMSQNALRLSWGREEVDARLLEIMRNIHAACLKYGKRADGSVSYIDGANIAGFVKVADAMLAQGVI